MQGGDWGVPGDVPSMGTQWWVWGCPRGAVGAAHSVRGWKVVLELWDCPASLKAPTVQPGQSGAGGGVAQLWPSLGPWRGPGHLFPQKNGVSGAGCGRCNRSGAFPA